VETVKPLDELVWTTRHNQEALQVELSAGHEVWYVNVGVVMTN
jgi:hypothetical protein